MQWLGAAILLYVIVTSHASGDVRRRGDDDMMTSHASSDVRRRGDDDSIRSLIAAVEKQAATIQGLQARIVSLETSRTDDQNKIQSLQTTTEKLSAKVAFSAHMSKYGVAIGDSSPFIFDAVVTNIGGAYTGHSGIFIAPTPGLYVFQFIMINNGNDPTVHAAIVKNGQVLAMGTSDTVGTSNTFDDGSALVTTHLAQGDQVYVKRTDTGLRVHGWWWCNFSGFLVSADV